MKILNLVEYLLYSLHDRKTFFWQHNTKYTGHEIQFWLFFVYPLFSISWTTAGARSSAEGTTDGECGGEGGGGGDGGGGDPVEQEPPLPWTINSRSRGSLLSLWRFKFNRSRFFEGHPPVHVDGPPLPSSACGDRTGRHVANWEGLQGGGGSTCAHKEQLWLAGYLVFSRPVWKRVKESPKKSNQNLRCYCEQNN